MSQSSGESYDNGKKGRDSFDEIYDKAFDDHGEFKSYRRSYSSLSESSDKKETPDTAGMPASNESASSYTSPSTGQAPSRQLAAPSNKSLAVSSTNDKQFATIIDLLGRLEDRLRRNENDREDTERDVEDLRRSMENLEDKYLQTDKNFFSLEDKVTRIDDLETRLKSINASDHVEFNAQIGEVRKLVRELGDKADDSERAYIKVEQKINTLARAEDDWRASEDELKKRQKVLEKTIYDSQEDLGDAIRRQQSDFQDIIQNRQIDLEKRLSERQSEISETQNIHDQKLVNIETTNDQLKERLNTAQTEQMRMIEKLDDILAQQGRLGRRLDKVDQDKVRLLRKIEHLSDIVDRNNKALSSKAMVLLTDSSKAPEQQQAHVHSALSTRDIVKRDDTPVDQELDDGDFNEEIDGHDEETPTETRLEERRVLTSREENEDKSASGDIEEKTQTSGSFAAGPFAERLTDFGQSEFSQDSVSQDSVSKDDAETKEVEIHEKNTSEDITSVEHENTDLTTSERFPRIDPADLEASNDSDFIERFKNSKTAIAAVILVFGLLAGWGASVLTNAGSNQDIIDLQQALELADQSRDANIAATNETSASIDGGREYLPGKRFDFENRGITESATSQHSNSQENVITRDDTPPIDGGTLRPDEQQVEPQQTPAEPSANEDTTTLAAATIEQDNQREELVALSSQLNQIEPSAPVTSTPAAVNAPTPSSVLPPQKPTQPTAEPAVARPQASETLKAEPNGTNNVLGRPFFDPLTDTALSADLKATNAQIETFIKSQIHGNLDDRIRADNTLSPIVQKIEEKAFQGIPEAQHDLAAIYTAGHAGTEQNFERAAFWFREAAVENIANARYNLGVLYHQGLGVKADLKQAIQWYRAASMLGHPEAQYNLGIAHIEGIGTNYRPKLATYYFMKAALQGVPEASYNLGLIYENGLVGSEYPEVALYWYQSAAEKGNGDAAAALSQLQTKLKLNEKDIQRITGQLKDQFENNNRRDENTRASVTQTRAKPQLASFSSNVTADDGDSLMTSIQRRLIDLGYYPGPADGAFGPKTEDAIRSYQKRFDLSVTGLPSRELLSHMETNG